LDFLCATRHTAQILAPWNLPSSSHKLPEPENGDRIVASAVSFVPAGHRPWTRLQWLIGIVWSVILFATCCRAFLYQSPRHQGIFAAYYGAGRDWLAGQDLYPRGYQGDAFVYAPPVAALMVPFSMLPPGVGSFLWRFCLVTLYLSALRQWVRSALPVELSP